MTTRLCTSSFVWDRAVLSRDLKDPAASIHAHDARPPRGGFRGVCIRAWGQGRVQPAAARPAPCAVGALRCWARGAARPADPRRPWAGAAGRRAGCAAADSRARRGQAGVAALALLSPASAFVTPALRLPGVSLCAASRVPFLVPSARPRSPALAFPLQPCALTRIDASAGACAVGWSEEQPRSQVPPVQFPIAARRCPSESARRVSCWRALPGPQPRRDRASSRLAMRLCPYATWTQS